MDKRIRFVAVFFVLCFGLLFLQLNNLQVHKAGALQKLSDEKNATTVSPYNLPRGDIVASNGEVLAYSSPTNDGYGYLRHYTNGPLYADVTGYFDVVNESNQFGIEDEYNGYLVQHESSVKNLGDLLTQTKGTDTIETTISPKLQAAAEAALAPYSAGAVVVIDPTTGAILAMYSKPSYNPNELASGNLQAVNKYYASLDPSSGSSPLVNGATFTLTAPGSTFKIITTSAILDHDTKLASEYIKPTGALKIAQTNQLFHNYGGEVCGGALAENLWQSCDTAYGQYGLQLGGPTLAEEANAFGLNKVPPIDLPASEVSKGNFPAGTSFTQNQPGLAYSAIGQEDVTESVLEDALIDSAIADGGTIMTPHLMAHIFNDQGQVVATYKPHKWLQATSIATADQVRNLMLGVVTQGTASAVGFPASLDVAAKTGTAEVGSVGCSSNWLVAMAPAGSGQVPKAAVAALVPYQPGTTCDGTGAEYAGPVVKQVLEAAVGTAG